MATKKERVRQPIFPLLFYVVLLVRDTGGKIQDLGYGINIPDPQHWSLLFKKCNGHYFHYIAR
jgi:hypothetical protein